MSPLVLRLALLSGLVAAGLSATSIIAWKFGFDPALGEPLAWRFYRPWAAVGWWEAWGHAEPYRRPFLSGLSLVAFVLILPMMAVRLLQMYGPLSLNTRSTNAGLSTPHDIRKSENIRTKGNGVVIGATGRWPWSPVLRDTGDGHVLIMGPARSGKGVGHVVPTLLAHEGSMLVIDPKRELHAIAGRRCHEIGPVFVVDPTAETTARVNPVLELRPGRHLIGDCQTMATMLAYSGQGEGRGGSSEDWSAAAADLVTTLLYHVRTSDDPTLAHLARLLQDVRSDRYPTKPSEYVRRNLDAHRALYPKVRDSVNFTLRTRLAFLDDPLIQHVTGGSDFRPGDLMAAPEPMTVFLSVPSSQRLRLRPLTRLLLQAFWAPMTDDLGVVMDGRSKRRPCLALIDEFPQLGRMDVLEHGIADCAGYGLRVALVCQSVAQIKTAYGASQSITDNCSTICVIPGFNGASLDEMSKWAGQHTIANASKQHSMGLKGSSSMSESEARIAVLNARDMLSRNVNEVLVFKHGLPPGWLRKVRYFKHRSFRGMFDPATLPAPQPAEEITLPTTTKEMPPWLLTHHS